MSSMSRNMTRKIKTGESLKQAKSFTGGGTNMTAFRWMLVLPLLFLVAGPASAQEKGTAAEAKAMLEKVVSDMKANKSKTLQEITAGTYNKEDLYPFCGGPDGKFTAHGANKALVGQSLKDLKDKSGEAFGEEIYKKAQAGKMSEVSYAWPRPNESSPVPKVAYVEKVDGEICAVGYYK
jgi:signal transduction histidine kinase